VQLRLDVAERFRRLQLESNSPRNTKVFASQINLRWGKMLRRDLEAAGIAYVDDSGRVADFHSLRHTFISNLARSGALPKVAQNLARHSTVGLTLNTYTHLGIHDERAALEKLPELPTIDDNNERHVEVALRTGTDDIPVDEIGSAYKTLTKKPDFGRLQPASAGTDRSELDQAHGQSAARRNQLQDEELDNDLLCVSSAGRDKKKDGPSRTRTCDTRIMSPLL